MSDIALVYLDPRGRGRPVRLRPGAGGRWSRSASRSRCGRRAPVAGRGARGFGDPTVLFIATLFVVSRGAGRDRGHGVGGRPPVAPGGEGRSRLVLLTMLLVAALTAVISVNGAVAALLPVVVVIAVRTGRAPSQLLMPLVFGAHAGSMLTLTGTPVNVIVSNYAQELTGTGFGFFEFALAGIPLLIGSIAVMLVIGSRVIPERLPKTIPADLSRHAETLVDQYGLDREAPAHLDLGASLLGRDTGHRGDPDPAPLVAHRRGGVPGHGHRRPATSSCSRSSATARTRCPARSRSWPATRSCSTAPGPRSRRTPATRASSSWTTRSSSAARPCRWDPAPGARSSILA